MQLEITLDHYTDIEKLALGAYAPVTEFMNESDFHSVTDSFQLSSGDFFPLPIFLDIAADKVDQVNAVIANKNKIELLYKNVLVASLLPNSVYEIDQQLAAEKIYGFTDRNHPGVDRFLNLNRFMVSGTVELLQRQKFDFSDFELTPEECRAEFKKRGWQTVVCFATRNVPHRGHEYLQRIALEVADGLFTHITTPPSKQGNYQPHVIKAGHQALIDAFYSEERAMVSFVSTTFRGAGPREALLQAVMKRNYGCSHFIIGRDHSGVKNYYHTYAAHELSKKYADVLGIEILHLHGPYYCTHCEAVVTQQTCRHHADKSAKIELKSTYIRETHANQEPVDSRIMRSEVYEAIKDLTILF